MVICINVDGNFLYWKTRQYKTRRSQDKALVISLGNKFIHVTKRNFCGKDNLEKKSRGLLYNKAEDCFYGMVAREHLKRVQKFRNFKWTVWEIHINTFYKLYSPNNIEEYADGKGKKIKCQIYKNVNKINFLSLKNLKGI